jgi:hypothetical protein
LPHKSKASLTNKGKERDAHQGRRSLAKRGRGGGGGCCTERRREARYRGVATCGAVGMRCKEGRCRTGKSRPCLRGIICPPGPGHRGRKESHFVPRVHTLRSVAAETCPCHAIVLFMDLFAKKKSLVHGSYRQTIAYLYPFSSPFPDSFPYSRVPCALEEKEDQSRAAGPPNNRQKVNGWTASFSCPSVLQSLYGNASSTDTEPTFLAVVLRHLL